MKWLVVLMACGSAQPATVSNRVPETAARQRLKTFVIAEYPHCTAPHHVEVFVDDVRVASVVVACSAPPPPPHKGVLVTSSDQDRVLVHGPLIDVAPGRHSVSALDLESGHRASESGTFPVYGALDVNEPKRSPLSDVFVVITSSEAVRVGVSVEANLVLL